MITLNYYGNVDLNRGVALDHQHNCQGDPLEVPFARFAELAKGRPLMVTSFGSARIFIMSFCRKASRKPKKLLPLSTMPKATVSPPVAVAVPVAEDAAEIKPLTLETTKSEPLKLAKSKPMPVASGF